MAVVYITEYARAGLTPRTGILAAEEPPVATQTVAITVGSVQSSVFNASTTFVRVATDAVCSVLFGANPTATSTSPRFAANSVEYFAVMPGQRLAVITNT